MSQILNIRSNHTTSLGLFVTVVHVAGFIGMLTTARPIFQLLTPLTLIMSFCLITLYHSNRDKSFYMYTSIIILGGFTIELIGVNTGWPFGDYSYGRPFGPQILGTPIVIGLNWFVLTYCGAIVAHRLTKSKWINAIVTGFLITAIDLILEPVAINSDYWTWEATSVPIANYITWFVCVSLFARMIYHFENKYDNKMVPWVLGAQLFFFIALHIAYRF